MVRVISRFHEQIISKVSGELKGRDFRPPPSLPQASVPGKGGDEKKRLGGGKVEEAGRAGCWGEPPGVGPRASWRLEPALELRPKLQRAVSSPPRSSRDAPLSPGHDRGGLGTRAPRASLRWVHGAAPGTRERAAGGGLVVARGWEGWRGPSLASARIGAGGQGVGVMVTIPSPCYFDGTARNWSSPFPRLPSASASLGLTLRSRHGPGWSRWSLVRGGIWSQTLERGVDSKRWCQHPLGWGHRVSLPRIKARVYWNPTRGQGCHRIHHLVVISGDNQTENDRICVGVRKGIDQKSGVVFQLDFP